METGLTRRLTFYVHRRDAAAMEAQLFPDLTCGDTEDEPLKGD